MFNRLQVAYEEICNLVPYERNARTHSKQQIRQIAASIRTFGFTNPVLVNRSKMIIAGHGRVQAARLLGMNKVPTICLDNRSEEHTSELQSLRHLVCRLLLEKK